MCSEFRNTLVWVTGSRESRRALELAIELARASNGRIGLLGAAPAPSPFAGAPPFAPAVSLARLAEDIVGEAVRQIEDAARVVPANVPVTKLLVKSRPAEALITQALHGTWDVIVIGESSSEPRLFRRSTAARVSKASPVPVLVVPAGSGRPRHAHDVEALEASRRQPARRRGRLVRPGMAS
jgi:nucleotide-binding universal stress UspA family protein